MIGLRRQLPRFGLWAGLITLVVSAGYTHAHQWADVPYEYFPSYRFNWSVVLIATMVVATYALGLPDQPRTRFGVVAASLGATATATMAVSIGQLVLGAQLLPRSVLLLVVLLTPVWSLLCWHLVRDLDERSSDRAQLLLIAEKVEDLGSLRFDLEHSAEKPARIVATATPEELAELTPSEFSAFVDETGASVIVVDVAAQADASLIRKIAEVHRDGIRVRTLSLFYEEWLGKLPISELERVSLLFDIGELHRLHYVRARRLVDLTCSGAGALVFAALMPFVLVGNAFANRGPLFFRQERVGKDGEIFEMLKLRTMTSSNASSEWTSTDDSRITRFGGLLRRSHLDELPQVLNVLRGELSIVGPRPEQVQYVEELRQKIAFYDARHTVRPGLTGWAQVKFGYASDEADALEKLQYDMFYLRRQGIRLDLQIIVRTIRAVFLQRGR